MDRRFEDHSRSLHREDGELGPSHLHIRNGPRFRTLDPGYGRQTNPPKVASPFAPESIWAELNLSRVSKQLNSVHFSSVRDHHCSSLLQSWHRSGFLVV